MARGGRGASEADAPGNAGANAPGQPGAGPASGGGSGIGSVGRGLLGILGINPDNIPASIAGAIVGAAFPGPIGIGFKGIVEAEMSRTSPNVNTTAGNVAAGVGSPGGGSTNELGKPLQGGSSGLSDFLLGSSDSASNQALSLLTSEQQALLKQIIAQISGNIDGPSNAALGASNIELSSLASLENLVNQVPGAETPSGTAATNTSVDALSSLSEIFGSGPQDINDFFTQTVEKPLLKQFSEDTIPGIRTRFAPQFFGGERIDAENRATEDLIDALTRERAAISFGARESDLNRKVNAAGVFPNVGSAAASLPFAGAGNSANILATLLQLGGKPSEIEQRQEAGRDRSIQQALAALGLPSVENLTTVKEGKEGVVPGFLKSFLGSFGEAAGSAASKAIF